MPANPDRKWFDERPERTKKCPRCGGCGTIDVGYALAPTDRVIDAPNNAVRAFVVGASSIFDACKEAADIAKRSGDPVAFEFNGQTVVLRPGDNADKVARDWWQKQYNETPEETLARR